MLHLSTRTLSDIYRLLSPTTQKIRKSLVLLARSCTGHSLLNPPTTPHSTLEKLVFLPLYDDPNNFFDNPEENLIPVISSLCSSTATSGLFLNLLYSLPYPDHVVDEIKEASMAKELSVCLTTRRPPQVNWEALFSPNAEYRFDSILSPNSPSIRPGYNEEVYEKLCNFRSKVSGVSVYPHSGPKGVSSETAFAFNTHYERQGHVSSNDLLREYLKSGRRIAGRTEMKQKWYPTGLAPRTYFAQGGDAFYDSMYLRNILNELADCFDPCHRFLRVSALRLYLHPDDPSDTSFFLYDFSSFSSNFSEQIYFLQFLAEFFSDCYVDVLGPGFTWLSKSLGGLIRQYIRTVNDLPEFYTGSSLPEQMATTLFHLQAGFLGVYGNLITCTIPHALFAGQFVQEDDQQSTAGDDGAIAIHPSLQEHFNTEMWRLGDYADSKVGSDLGIYLKRPVALVDRHLRISDMIVYPNLCIARMLRTKDSRFGRRPSICSLYTSLIGSVMGFLRSVSDYQDGNNLTSDEKDILLAGWTHVYTIAEMDLDGNISDGIEYFDEDDHECLKRFSYPPVSEVFFKDPYEMFLLFLNRERRMIPVLRYQRIELHGDISAGDEHIGNVSTGLQFLLRIGMVVKEEITTFLFGEDCTVYNMEQDPIDFQLEYASAEYNMLDQNCTLYKFTFLEDISFDALVHLGLGVPVVDPFKEDIALEEVELFFHRKKRSVGWVHDRYTDWDKPPKDLTDELWYDDVDWVRQGSSKRLKTGIMRSKAVSESIRQGELPVIDPTIDGFYYLD